MTAEQNRAVASMVHSYNPLVAPTPVAVQPFTPVGDLAPKVHGNLMLKLNGEWTLRKDWGRIVAPGDIIEWHEIPQGGNTSRTVLQVVVAIIAAYVGYQIGGPVGAAWALGINLAGNALINAIIPFQAPRQPDNSLASPGSVYNGGTAANQARLGQPIPVIYGRHKVFPDYAAQPYIEYRDNDSYFHCVYCVGQGAYPDGEWFIDGVRA